MSLSLMDQLYSLKSVEKVFSIPPGKLIIGNPELKRLDPFLILDNFSTKLPCGFSDHPYRGYEKVTYMLEGKFLHEDSTGNKGTLNPGDLLWITAGKGIIHAEMPGSWEEKSVGFQIWINLSSKEKFCEPQHQEITKENIPMAMTENVTVKVMAGESFGVKGSIKTRTPVLFLDVEIRPYSVFEQVIPKGWNAFCYVFKGEGLFGAGKEKASRDSCVLLKRDESEMLLVETDAESVRFVLLAGKPLNEPVVGYGRFVLNTKEELQKTLLDYNCGQNGFEAMLSWESKIKHLVKRNPN